ncbi:hypothetical protein I4U23_004732 [Adineta vaga]|nr:hypothetical protein I4U23_004732 [Adineta vaga]
MVSTKFFIVFTVLLIGTFLGYTNGYACSDLRDCTGCLRMAPTCHWCIKAGSGHVPRCTEGSNGCDAWYGSGVHECASG